MSPFLLHAAGALAYALVFTILLTLAIRYALRWRINSPQIAGAFAVAWLLFTVAHVAGLIGRPVAVAPLSVRAEREAETIRLSDAQIAKLIAKKSRIIDGTFEVQLYNGNTDVLVYDITIDVEGRHYLVPAALSPRTSDNLTALLNPGTADGLSWAIIQANGAAL